MKLNVAKTDINKACWSLKTTFKSEENTNDRDREKWVWPAQEGTKNIIISSLYPLFSKIISLKTKWPGIHSHLPLSHHASCFRMSLIACHRDCGSWTAYSICSWSSSLLALCTLTNVIEIELPQVTLNCKCSIIWFRAGKINGLH